MKVFSKEKYLEDKGCKEHYKEMTELCSELGFPLEKYWVHECDGKEVTGDVGNLRCGEYLIDEDWCIETEEESNMEKKYTMAEFEEMFDKAVEQTLASWEIAGEMAKTLMSGIEKEKIEMYASLSLDQNKGVLDGLKTILFGDADEHK